MTRKLIGGALWYVAVSGFATFGMSLIGGPEPLGAILGIVVAGFVVLDPTGKVWSARITLPERTRSFDSVTDTEPALG
jgi:hypothetical protein